MPKHLHIESATFDQAATPPINGAVVTAPTGILYREVYGHFAITPSGVTPRSINIETRENSGTAWVRIGRVRAPAGLGGELSENFNFKVQPGWEYRFIVDDTGGSGFIGSYSTLDVG